ncbi:MAG: rod shape-determining protein MreC [Planctomycetota bacterium]|jgi:rod shape-determining protein MreC
MLRLSPKTRGRLRLVVVLVAVAAFLFLMPRSFTAPARVLFNEAVGPVQKGALQGTGHTLALTGTLTEMFFGEDREQALAKEATRLSNKNVALSDELRRQKQDLASLQKLAAKEMSFRAIRAPVASYDASAMHRSITVRAGRSDGVALGMAAAAEGALVGIVAEAGPRHCRVRLITDPDSAVPCRLSRTRDLCVLQGTGGETCAVDWVSRDGFVEPQDVLVTASLTARPGSELRLPDGLPAATVTDVQRDKMRPLWLAVKAEPRVNLNRLEGVEILIPETAPP